MGHPFATIVAGQTCRVRMRAVKLQAMKTDDPALLPVLERIALALERLAPPAGPSFDPGQAEAFVWHAASASLEPVLRVNRVEIGLLKGISQVMGILTDNTMRFAHGAAANNALLWGARGMGKSSLVKAAHAQASQATGGRLKLVEIHREEIESLPDLMRLLRQKPDFRFILFCDDLSFDNDDTSYKALKAALDGGIEGRPENVVFYATSNRRHLLPRDMIENERSTAINPDEVVQEKVSLSDRFGLWLGFHNCSQDDYFAMVEAYAQHYGIDEPVDALRAGAVEWSVTRGSRSGRVAWQFIQDIAGRKGLKI
jgi:uncharacterized protein